MPPPPITLPKRAYVVENELRATWEEEVAPALLSDDERTKAASFLSDALKLMCDTGEIFMAAGLIFLNPAFATDLLKPLTDHRLSVARGWTREQELPAIEEHIRATGQDANPRAASQLLRAVEAHVKLGILRSVVFPLYWRGTALAPADFPRAITMLCDAGVLFPMGDDQWAMPMRLPAEKPEEVDMLWTEAAPPPEQAAGAQLGVRFDLFNRAMPAGAIERCVAKCTSLGSVQRCWRNGALVASGEDGQVLALLQQTHDADAGRMWLELFVRGPEAESWKMLHALRATTDGVLSEYGGVQYDELLLCPSCQMQGRVGADAKAWDIEGEVKNRKAMRCEKCAKSVPILQNILGPVEEAAAAAPVCAAAESPPTTAQPTGDIAAAPTVPSKPAASKPAAPPIKLLKSKFTAFLSHNWGPDDEGRDNHQRVLKLAKAMNDAGLPVWTDEEQMHGDILEKMTDGIDDSACVVVFVTQNYINKAGGKGPNGKNDNCKLECACHRHRRL